MPEMLIRITHLLSTSQREFARFACTSFILLPSLTVLAAAIRRSSKWVYLEFECLIQIIPEDCLLLKQVCFVSWCQCSYALNADTISSSWFRQKIPEGLGFGTQAGPFPLSQWKVLTRWTFWKLRTRRNTGKLDMLLEKHLICSFLDLYRFRIGLGNLWFVWLTGKILHHLKHFWKTTLGQSPHIKDRPWYNQTWKVLDAPNPAPPDHTPNVTWNMGSRGWPPIFEVKHFRAGLGTLFVSVFIYSNPFHHSIHGKLFFLQEATSCNKTRSNPTHHFHWVCRAGTPCY